MESQVNAWRNRLFHGDALAVAAALPDGIATVVYADPPFFTGQARRAANGVFADRWESLTAYINWLRPYLSAFHRLLRPDGTLYLHLDWHAVHYAKVAADDVFGVDHFMNEVVWHYGLGAAAARRHFLRKHDTLLVYRRGPRPVFNVLRGPVTAAMAAKYRHQDAQGRYMHSRGRRYYLKGGKPLDSVWAIPAIGATSAERLGYPTQKPVTLLERVIGASSNPGDLVLDLFCGSGTTAVVAERLGRRWLVGDAAAAAVALTAARLARLEIDVCPERVGQTGGGQLVGDTTSAGCACSGEAAAGAP